MTAVTTTSAIVSATSQLSHLALTKRHQRHLGRREHPTDHDEHQDDGDVHQVLTHKLPFELYVGPSDRQNLRATMDVGAPAHQVGALRPSHRQRRATQHSLVEPNPTSTAPASVSKRATDHPGTYRRAP